MYVLFLIVMCVPFSVLCVLFVCKCVLYCCHRVSTKLLLNIYMYHTSYNIISYHITSYHIVSFIIYHINYIILHHITSYRIVSYHIKSTFFIVSIIHNKHSVIHHLWHYQLLHVSAPRCHSRGAIIKMHANLSSAPLYRNDWHVGLHTSVIMNPWGCHLGAETCRSWCRS
jgi:hypothetical protein